MKNIFFFLFVLIHFVSTGAANKDSLNHYNLPDSVKVVSLITDIKISAITSKKEFRAGIRDRNVQLYIETDKKDFEFVFEFPAAAKVVASGIGVKNEKGEMTWNYPGTANDIYKLLISTASDSSENFIVYSGYAFLSKENKWKLIGTCKITGQWGTMKNPSSFFTKQKKNQPVIQFSNNWCQRSNGSWKNLNNETTAAPVINLFSHVDSLTIAGTDNSLINMASEIGNEKLSKDKEGVYYNILREGTGRQVRVSDTVTVYYKGHLFSDGTVFDQTKEKSVTFSLKRLIRGWQIGVPLCKVGGKIKLVIPSGLAYSIRTRAAKIPPNSILVFEIEVVDAREGK